MAKKRRKRRSGLSVALETLQKKYEAQKAKIMQRGVKPLLARAKQLQSDLAAVQKEITQYMGDSAARLTGQTTGTPATKATRTAKAAPATKGKRRKRMSADDKLKVAGKVYSMFTTTTNKGKKFGQKDLHDFIQPLKMRELVPLWNKANPEKKISKEGDKATTVYFVKP